MDAEYFPAVRKGDTETAQRLVEEAAQGRGAGIGTEADGRSKAGPWKQEPAFSRRGAGAAGSKKGCAGEETRQARKRANQGGSRGNFAGEEARQARKRVNQRYCVPFAEVRLSQRPQSRPSRGTAYSKNSCIAPQ